MVSGVAARRRNGSSDGAAEPRGPNLSLRQRNTIWIGVSLGVEDLFHHVVATLHDPAYRAANAGALRMDWPRIPLPGWPDGDLSKAWRMRWLSSAARGRELAVLLDSDTPVVGVTTGESAAGAGIHRGALPPTDVGNMVTATTSRCPPAGAISGTGEAVMPGQGRVG